MQMAEGQLQAMMAATGTQISTEPGTSFINVPGGASRKGSSRRCSFVRGEELFSLHGLLTY